MGLLRLLLLTLLWTPTGQEVPVVPVKCVVKENCVLPYSIKPKDNLVLVEWVKIKENFVVHSYLKGKDIPEKQNPAFRGRTSIFPKLVSGGNASLQLMSVKPTDRGEYICKIYTSSSRFYGWVNLLVEGPVESVTLEWRGDVLVCSSEDIFPKPNISWIPNSEHQTQVKEMTNSFYSISSSLPLDVQPKQPITCNISTDKSWKSAIYSLQPPMERSASITIPCVDSKVPEKSLKWTFNYIQTIVSRSGAEVTYTDSWRPFVENVSEWGSLSLKELSEKQEGEYVCELQTGDLTYISRTELGKAGSGPSSVGIAIGVIVVVILVIAVIIIIMVVLWRKYQQKLSTEGRSTEGRSTEEELVSLLRPKKTNILRDLLDENLTKEELPKFKSFLSDQSLMKGFPILPKEKLDEEKLSEVMIKTYGVHSISVTKRVLTNMQRNNLPQKLSDYDPEEIIDKCKDEMKSRLKKRLIFITEETSEMMKFIEGYTELFITEEGSGKIIEKHEVKQMETLSGRPAEERTVLKDIFKDHPRTGKPTRTVLTKGRAGVGTSMLTQKFSLDWAKGRANQDVQLLFPFTFRELNVVSDRQFSLVGLVHHFFKESKDLFSFNCLKVTFIFDGLEEFRLPLDFNRTRVLTDDTESASLGVLLVNLIRGDLLPSARLWITTRPAAAKQIPNEHVSMVTEVRGFTDEQKEQYFRKRFSNKQQATDVISHIKSSPSLYMMCRLPVVCRILSTVLLHLMKTRERPELPHTLTQIYIHFLIVQAKVKNIKNHEGTMADLHWTPKKREMVTSLGKLAWEQLQRENLIFSESDLKDCELNGEITRHSGVITEVFREESDMDQGKVYCFIHQSVQEFLAALHILQTFISSEQNLLSPPRSSGSPQSNPDSDSESDLEDDPQTTFYCSAVNQALQIPNGHLNLLLRFLLGLSLPTNQNLLKGLLIQTGSDSTNQNLLKGLLIQTGSDSTYQETVAYIHKRLSEESLSAERSLNLLHCLNELKDPSLTEEIQKFIRKSDLSDRYISPAEWLDLSFLLLSSDLKEFDLRKYDPSEKCLKGLLPVVKAYTKVTLSGCGLSNRSCAPLASVLSSSSLTHLDLSSNFLQNSGVEQLCEGLKSDSCRLETLSLSGCGLSSYATLASVLSCSSLKHLDISNNDLKDSGLELLCEGLRSAPCRLETLSLSRCGLSSRAPLASVLSCSSLKHLDISNNDLKDSGVEKLCEGLKSAPCRLDTLRLSGCLVSKRGGASLADALRSLSSSLRELDLRYNHLGASTALLTALQEDPNSLRLDPDGERWMVPGLRKYACEFSLDPNTAYKSLRLSEDNQSVTHVKEDQQYPDHQDRFTDWGQVLSSTGLTGRCYWEVDWKGAKGIFITMSYRSIKREGKTEERRFGYNTQSWSLMIGNGQYSAAHNKKRIRVANPNPNPNPNPASQSVDDVGKRSGPPAKTSGRVGVYLDSEAGALSFYEVIHGNKLFHLHTFNTSFTKELFPGFRLVSPGDSVSLCQRGGPANRTRARVALKSLFSETRDSTWTRPLKTRDLTRTRGLGLVNDTSH